MVQQQSGDAQANPGADAQKPWRGQHWLISGAAGSLGSSLAQQMATQGAVLVLVDKNKRALEQLADIIEKAGGEAPYLFPLDLGGASPEDYQRFVEALQQHLGHLDGVVHTVAHFEGLTPLMQTPPLQWWVSLQANLSGPLLLSRELVPLLRDGAERRRSATAQNGVVSDAENARLAFILDELERCSEAYWGAYGVSQWAWHGLCRQFAAELSNLPISVSGLITPAFQSALRARAFPAEYPGDLPTAQSIATRILKQLQQPAASGSDADVVVQLA